MVDSCRVVPTETMTVPARPGPGMPCDPPSNNKSTYDVPKYELGRVYPRPLPRTHCSTESPPSLWGQSWLRTLQGTESQCKWTAADHAECFRSFNGRVLYAFSEDAPLFPNALKRGHYTRRPAPLQQLMHMAPHGIFFMLW
ncbi:unnamed protein product [Phytophthora fragariaefolia]|uniref:Unnamed protein product n=1 Tax=Phytophthora fragariaefolia TaxID=1490495 RepID=A0A9W6TZM4_9STRA|nr:unnamed protein product [Phytophthora fragariaefolia]